MANATIRVQFGGDSAGGIDGGYLSAEIDSRPAVDGGLNGGKTSFMPGDTVHILVFKSANVAVTETAVSAGSISAAGTATVEVDEEIMFEDADTARLDKPCAGTGLTSSAWMGRDLGALTLQADKITVKAAQSGVAVASVKYSATALVYALTAPASIGGDTDFSILAVIKGGPA